MKKGKTTRKTGKSADFEANPMKQMDAEIAHVKEATEAEELVKDVASTVAQIDSKTKSNPNMEFLRVLIGMVLLVASYLSLKLSSHLWLTRDGFAWGALMVVVLGVTWGLCELSGIVVFGIGGFHKAKEYKTASSEVAWLVCLYSAIMMGFGWECIRIGWCHWWTGVLPSVLFLSAILNGLRLFILGCLNTVTLVRKRA